MEFLGTVEGITSEGHALIRCDNIPDLGTNVYDDGKHRIGTVKRILGSVDCPYASVSLDAEIRSLKGKKVFFNQNTKDGANKRKFKKH